MKILVDYLKLMRLDKPVGFILLFLPCAFGLAYASHYTYVSPWIYFLFLYGSIIMRAAGCIINDILDRDLDKKVARTKDRPIAAGRIKIFDALVLAFLLFIAGAVILLSLHLYAVYIGLFSVLLVFLYPLMKRIINYPQLFLGFTFNIGFLISYTHAMQSLNLSVVLLYVGCIFWTFGYDTIYGYQDKQYDEKIGIRSASISFDRYSSLFLSICYGVFFLSLALLGVMNDFSLIYYIVLSLPMLHATWQIVTLKKNDAKNCLIRFKSNVVLGVIILCIILFIQVLT